LRPAVKGKSVVIDEMDRSTPEFWQVFLVVINVGKDLPSTGLLSRTHCGTTNQKAEGLFPDGVIKILH
jgi:hypothetical protein